MSNYAFRNLADLIRDRMKEEVESDISNGTFFISKRLNSAGKEIYSQALLYAISKGTEVDLQKKLESSDYFNKREERNGKLVKVPSNAAQLLAQSEFNRYYIRGVCLQAIEEDIEEVEIYRARDSSFRRAESERKIGTKVNARDLLEDLRVNIGKEPLILPEVNSGLSVKY